MSADAADASEAAQNFADGIEGSEPQFTGPLGFSGSNSRLHLGAGTPDGGLGSNGDFYFQTDAVLPGGDLIYVKSGGAWTAIVTG